MSWRDPNSPLPPSMQAVLEAYQQGEPVANDALYAKVESQVIHRASQQTSKPVPESCRHRNLVHRHIRWQQQSLRQLGLIEKVDGQRGVWRLKASAKELTPAVPGKVLLAFSTRLGLALWGSCHDVFRHIDEPVALILTSPPYPIAKPRAYGGVTAVEFADFVCRALEPIVRNLARGGNVALNIGQDCFNQGLPSRSLHIERTILALHDSLGLQLMDRLVWNNPARPPGPVQWASKSRQQLNATWEPVLWFTNDPAACFADNRRVLQAHSARQQRLMERGGEPRASHYGDGAYRLRPGSFGATTPGAIPRNVLSFTHNSSLHAAHRKAAIARGLPTHGACMPIELARFLVEFLSRKDDLVVDPFGGWLRTALAAEEAGRRWVATELMGEYAAGAAIPFLEKEGFRQHFELAA